MVCTYSLGCGYLEIIVFLGTEILTGYLYFWRLYRLILARLRGVHGIKRFLF